MAGIARSLGQAFDTLRDDPVGILLPAGALLLLQVLAAMVVRAAVPDGLEAVAWALLAALAVRLVLGAPLRSRMIAQAARARGLAASPWGRPVALLGVHLVTGPLVVGVFAGLAVPSLVAGIAIAGEGWFTTGAFAVAIGVLAATLAALVVRAALGLAPSLVVVGGRSALGALWDSLRHAHVEGLRLVVLIGLGDLLVGLGGLLCGAGALPGYPIADLAALDRFRVRFVERPGG